MANKQPTGSNRQSCAKIQTTIHEALVKISNQARRRALLPPRQSNPTNVTEASNAVSTSTATRNRTEQPSTSKASDPVNKSTAQQRPPNEPPTVTSNAPGTPELLDNSYARELFFRHTNIRDVVAKKLPERSENTRQKYAPQLYRLYVLEPAQRIREHLHEVRFDTRFHEGLLRMALQVPLTSEQAWNAHKETLAKAGIRKLCFVDMTQNNRLLDYQEKVVRKLKAEFRNWSGKLNKLPTYLSMCQQQREAEDRKFLALLKHHSTLKDSWALHLPSVMKKLLQERWLPSERRTNLIWSVLRFDDDHLNRKYEVGDYSKFQFNVEVEPEEVVDYSSQALDLGSFAEDDQRCITPINVTNNRTPAREQTVPREIVAKEEEITEKPPAATIPVDPSENVPQNHQRFAVPAIPVPDIIEISDSPARTANRPVNSTVNAAGYTLQYVKHFTNIYEVVIENYMERNRDKNLSFTQSKADNYVRKFYTLFKDTFARRELPVGIRLLTPAEQEEQVSKGPLKWVLERLDYQNASLQTNNNEVQVVVAPSANPVPSNPQPTAQRPPAANQPKAKLKKMDHILKVPCPIRTARIPYDSDSSLSQSPGPSQREDNAPNDAAHHSIAFVPIVEDNFSQPLPQEDSAPISQEFTPFASSTQNQSPLYRRRSTQLTELHPVATQDPLQLSGTSTTTIAPFHAIVPCESSGSTHTPPMPTQSQSQPSSSIIPPFQLVNATPTNATVTTVPSSPVPSLFSYTVKQEAISQLPADTSGYEDEVEIIPNPDNLIILSESLTDEHGVNFSDFNKSIDSINARVIGILTRNEADQNEDEQYLSCAEPTTSNSSLEGRSRKRAVKVDPEPEPAISPPRIGPYISFEAPRKTRQRQALATVPLAAIAAPNTRCPSNSHMMFLHRVHIQSVRYSTHPTTWSHCGVFQANPLTVHLNPGSAGLFSVPVCDQQACLLLMGASAGGKGTEALLAALEHAGKFRYGSREPEREYYRLSITEKVLHLFFATFPACPQDGGLVMFPKIKSNVPADGDEMWLERFNYYAHVKPNRRADKGGGTGGDSLAQLLMPGIGRRMKALREKLVKQSGAIVL